MSKTSGTETVDAMRGRKTGIKGARRERIVLAAMYTAAVILAGAILLYKNPAPPGSSGFNTIIGMRIDALVAILLVAVCQSIATVLFHTASANRILTPSILGFDALYVLTQTALVFSLGVMAERVEGIPKIIVQSVLMILFATLLYGWLFTKFRASLHKLLLIGVILGIGFGSVSTFMQRLLTPSEFDVLAARLIGSISNANADYLPIAGTLVLALCVYVWHKRRIYDVLALGREIAVSLGLNYRLEIVKILVIVAFLVSIAVTMIGPMTFYGFLVATLSYQFVTRDSHQHTLPMALGVGLVTLLAATFILKHIFYAAGLVTVIIEFGGGLLFLIVLLKRGLK